MEPLFEFPQGLELVSHFYHPRVQTWGSTHDQAYKEMVRAAAGLPIQTGDNYAWFAFTIRCVVARSRERVHRQIPDVENIPKLIVDAFTDILYPDDHLQYVRGVQVEAEFGIDEKEQAEVWIFGCPKKG